MKLRLGFVSNSSSSCFICGESISECESYCDSCLSLKTIKEFLDFAEQYLNISKEELLEKYRETFK